MTKLWIAITFIVIFSDISLGMPGSRWPGTTEHPKLNWRTGLYQHGRVKYVEVNEDNFDKGGPTRLECRDSRMRDVSSCTWSVGVLAMNETAMMNGSLDNLVFVKENITCLMGNWGSNCTNMKLINNCSVEVWLPPVDREIFEMFGEFDDDSGDWDIPKPNPYALKRLIDNFPYDEFRCHMRFTDGTNVTSDPTSLVPYRERDDPSFWEGIGDFFDFGGIKDFFGMGGNDTMAEERNGTSSMGAVFGDGKVAVKVGQTVERVAISVEKIVRSVSGLIDMIQERIENRDRMPKQLNQTEPMMMG